MRRLSFDEVVDRLLVQNEPYQKNYLAMYSSWYGGIITDPALMMVPADDHLVHRGDGVFETFKCLRWKVYALPRHFERMERSARASMIDLPVSRIQLEEIVLSTIAEGNSPDCLVKLFLSRGPGGFSANPYECTARQVFVIVTTLPPQPEGHYTDGVKLITSKVPVKDNYFATIKTCNYLQNVLMRKEAIDAGADFAVSVDERGFLAEGATENFGIITEEREFLVPRFDRILRGITVSRMIELARPLLLTGELTSIGEADISIEHARNAAEIMTFGTSFDVLPITTFDDRPVGDGKPGPFFRRFLDMMRDDTLNCRRMLTPVQE